MRNAGKTEGQLINELTTLREHVSEMEKTECEHQRVEHILRERNKCIYSISRVFDIPNIALDQLYQEVVNQLPNGCNCPDITCARISVGTEEFKTENYVDTNWKQSFNFKAKDKKMYTLEVCHLEGKTEIEIGSFSEEEGLFINHIAERLARITERRQAEEALQKSEERFRALTESTSDMVWEMDIDAVHTYTNPKVKDLLGYEPEEINGRAPFRSMPARVREEYRKRLLSILKSGEPFERLENTMLHKDGHEVIMEGSGVPLFDADGRLYGYRGIDRDITERKKAEVALRESEERFRALTESTSDWVWELDVNVVHTYANPRVKDLLGYEPEEIIGKTPFGFMPLEEAERFKEKFQASLKSGEPFERLENTMLHKDGHEVIMESSGVPFSDTDGRLCGYRGIDRDITERKKAEVALRESEEFSSKLLSNAPNVIVVVNPDTSIRYVNPALEKLTGFSTTDVIGKKAPYPWWTKETLGKVSSKLRKAMLKQATRTEELYRKKTGEPFRVEVTSVPVRSNGKLKYSLLTWIDITEEKRLRENMQYYITEITKAQEEERKRVARELHDETIQELADLCTEVDKISMMGQSSGEAVQQMEQLRSKINDIIDGIRHFSNELRPGRLDRFGLIPTLELLVEEVEKGSELNCRVEVVGSEWRLSSEAELGLFRITQEALRNVKKHSGATEVVVSIEFAADGVGLSIIDNGCGFELPRAVGSLAREGKLGLIGIRERARLLNGNFSIKSMVGEGTTVVVKLPAEVKS